jgi:predicted O-methyltransferase YrrM
LILPSQRLESAYRQPPPKEGLKQLFTRAAWRSFRHQPRWFFANVFQAPRWYLDQRKAVPPERYQAYFASEAAAVSAMLDVPEDLYHDALASMWTPERDPAEPREMWAARKELINLLGALVSLMRPNVVVETGVALGFTTATILAAMRENGRGHLYSVDLPAVQYGPQQETGSAVPADFRDRWTLVLGRSEKVLPPLLRKAEPVDLFLHDANHAYSAQLREYRAAWPHLRPGGVLVSDDVGNPAFIEFAAEVEARPYLVPGSRSDSAVGLIRKS